jgi:hypothetical protein
MTITLDAVPYKVQTRASDHTAAEVMTTKADGGTIESRPVSHGFRIAFATFRRCYPDHDLARSFPRFLEVLDEIEGLDDAVPTDEYGEALEPAPLDPTPPADGDV